MILELHFQPWNVGWQRRLNHPAWTVSRAGTHSWSILYPPFALEAIPWLLFIQNWGRTNQQGSTVYLYEINKYNALMYHLCYILSVNGPIWPPVCIFVKIDTPVHQSLGHILSIQLSLEWECFLSVIIWSNFDRKEDREGDISLESSFIDSQPYDICMCWNYFVESTGNGQRPFMAKRPFAKQIL